MSAAGFGYCCAVVVAVVFAAAALAKFRQPALTAASFDALGLPASATFARVVPIVEVLIAVGLVVVPSIGGLAALTTLAFFTTFLVTRLRAGVRAPCSCFGSASQRPLSPANLVGNGFLLLASAAAMAAPTPTRPTTLDVLVLFVAIAAEVTVHAAVRRRVDTPSSPSATRSRPAGPT